MHKDIVSMESCYNRLLVNENPLLFVRIIISNFSYSNIIKSKGDREYITNPGLSQWKNRTSKNLKLADKFYRKKSLGCLIYYKRH